MTLLVCSLIATASEPSQSPSAELDLHFQAPDEYREVYGDYRSPLVIDEGATVTTAKEWKQRRERLRNEWHELLGPWPPLIGSPQAVVVSTEKLDGIMWAALHIAAGIERENVSGYLLTPPGEGPFPAVLVVYYEPETGVGLGVEMRDFAIQMARRGFVALSIGPPGTSLQTSSGPKVNAHRPYYGPVGKPVRTQPLSALAYAAANCHTFLASQPNVDEQRIGVMGHSFGGKWAMFASCLFDRFACAVWSDPGIVFDERVRKDNVGAAVNYWDRWYLGYQLGEIAVAEDAFHRRGLPKSASDRTGSYRKLIVEGRDLVELHALMAPRPFLVSGGTADRQERWPALNHAIAVNRLLGKDDGVAMVNRNTHSPNQESNDQIYSFLEWCLCP